MIKKRILKNSLLILLLALSALAVRPLMPAPFMDSISLISCGGNSKATGNAFKLDVPEPFHPFDAIGLTMAESTECVLAVYDRWGRMVQLLTRFDRTETGKQAVFWNGRRRDGSFARPGTYRVAVRTDEGTVERPLLLVIN